MTRLDVIPYGVRWVRPATAAVPRHRIRGWEEDR